MLIGTRLRIALVAVVVATTLGTVAVAAGLTAPLNAVAAEFATAGTGPQIDTITSASHPDPAVWYKQSRVSLSWSSADTTVTGSSFLIDRSAETIPDTVSEGAVTAQVFDAVPDGTSYFHVRAVDGSGDWGPALHFRVNVDATDPLLPLVTSPTHGSQAAWTADRGPSFAWSATDAASGIAGFSFALDQIADTTPPTTSSGTATSAQSAGLVDGLWYFHVRAVDAAGNWGPAQHHLVRVDATAPTLPVVTSPTHPTPGTAYSNDDPTFTWSAADAASGVAGYSYTLDRRGSTRPDTHSEGHATSRSYSGLATGVWYFHVRAVDAAGTWGMTRHFRIEVAAATQITGNGTGSSGTTTTGDYGSTGSSGSTSGPTTSMPNADPDYALLSRFPGAVFPVTGRFWYADWWHAPRAGGRVHEGCDIFAAYGTPVVAVQGGVISNVSTTGIGGNNLRLSNDQGDYFYYAHLSAFATTTVMGVRVEAGQTLGYVGTTGDAQGTDPHLHFEIHPLGGAAVDPYPYLEAWRAAGSQLGPVTQIPGGPSTGGFDPSLAPDAEAAPAGTTTDPALAAALERVAVGLQALDDNLVDSSDGSDTSGTTAEAVLTMLTGMAAIAVKRLKMAALLL